MFLWQWDRRHLDYRKTKFCDVNLLAAIFGDQRIKRKRWMKHRYQKLYSATLKILTNTVFALAWHWHWCWHWHSCGSSYRVGQRPSLIRRRVPWGILRRVPWVLWSVVIGRWRWCWCTLCKNWWLCCKYATKNLKQGSKIRSGLENKCVVSYFTCPKCTM